MADLYNSGTIGHSSVVLTIDEVTYIAEDVSINDPTNRIERNDEANNFDGLILTQGAVTGSATLQLATATTALPAKGETFTADLLRAGSTQTWVIDGRTPTFAVGEAHKVGITFTKVP